MRSPTINASRYSNGTLVKIQTTGDNFLSVNYDPEKQTGTFTPDTIRMTPTYSGGVGFGGWVYRKGTSDSWTAVTSGEHGLTLSNDVLIVSSASDLFETGNDSTVTFRVNGDDGLHWDSLTIMRYVSPLAVYRKANTKIIQTNETIELIASSEELKQYAVGNTLAKNFASFKQTSEGFEQTVRANYATKAVAQGYANNAAASANNATDQKLTNYSTTAQMNSAIRQSAQAIELQVSQKVGNDEIISKINQTAETIKIQASKVNLSGYATFSALQTAGATVINGSNITTGTIKDPNGNTTWNLSTGALNIKMGSIDIGGGAFTVSAEGALTATGAQIAGSFRSESGSEWLEMNESRLRGGSTPYKTDATIDLSAGDTSGDAKYTIFHTDLNKLIISGKKEIRIGANGYGGIESPEDIVIDAGDVRITGDRALVNGFRIATSSSINITTKISVTEVGTSSAVLRLICKDDITGREKTYRFTGGTIE